MAKRSRKSNTEAFSILPKRLIISKEFNQLSVHARWLYVVMTTEWRRNGEEEKEFIIPYHQIRDITGFREDRISCCLKELLQSGFIEVTEKGGLLHNPNKYKMNTDWLRLKTSTHGNNN